MPPKTSGDELQEILTKLAVIEQRQLSTNERIMELISSVEKNNGDHERRIRDLESGWGAMGKELGIVRERMTIFNLMQGSLTALAATLAYWLKK